MNWKASEDEFSVFVKDSTEKIVADVRAPRPPSMDEQRRIARLIAAAPDLKLACEGALVALQLGEHVDRQQAIDFAKETLSRL